MSPFWGGGRKSKSLEPPEVPPAPPCEHVHYHIAVINLVGYGTCEDCGKFINLAILFNGTAQRLIALEQRLINKLVDNTTKGE